MPISRDAALARLRDARPITYDELDDIFNAFGFSGDLRYDESIWYEHPKWSCGRFRAKPLYDFSTITEDQRGIVATMIQQLLAYERIGGKHV